MHYYCYSVVENKNNNFATVIFSRDVIIMRRIVIIVVMDVVKNVASNPYRNLRTRTLIIAPSRTNLTIGLLKHVVRLWLCVCVWECGLGAFKSKWIRCLPRSDRDSCTIERLLSTTEADGPSFSHHEPLYRSQLLVFTSHTLFVFVDFLSFAAFLLFSGEIFTLRALS